MSKKKNKKRIKKLEQSLIEKDELILYWMRKRNMLVDSILDIAGDIEQARQVADKSMYGGQLDEIRNRLGLLSTYAQQVYTNQQLPTPPE